MGKPRVAILGGRGMLGSDVALICEQQNLDFQVFDLPEFDITDPERLSDTIRNYQTIVNCAAYTDVDGAETQDQLAYQVNAAAVGRLGEMAKQAGCWVLHISTDFVFDGRLDRPYVETDAPNPINTYGRTKLAGEKLLAESGCRHCIIRLQWTYGWAGRNFVTKLIEQAKTNPHLRVVDDQIGSPTATTEAAAAICRLLSQQPEGLFHFAAAGYVTRFDMARFIFDRLKMPIVLTACESSDFPSPAARPLNSRFDCSKILALLAEPIKQWQEPLASFLEQL